MAKNIFTNIILFTRRHIVLILTFLIFSLLWDAAMVKEGSGGWIIGGSASGAAAGGFAGWIIGGIGVVAMGSGVGIPAAAVIGLGALFGGAAGGAAGGGIGALLAGEIIDPIILAMVFCMSLGAAFIIVYAVRTLRSAINSLRSRLFGKKEG